MSSNLPVIVVDCGSDTFKAGFAGDSSPRSVFSSKGGTRIGKGYGIVKDVSGRLDETGIFTNWDSMINSWHQLFYSELNVNPGEVAVLCTEPPLNHKSNRECMVQLMFESFAVQAFYSTSPAVLALHASGRSTGCILDVGHLSSYAVPVYEGTSLQSSIVEVGVAGQHLTEHIISILEAKNEHLFASKVCRDIKEMRCIVSQDVVAVQRGRASENTEEQEFELPDGTVVMIGALRFGVPEVLFQPSLLTQACCRSDHGRPPSVVECEDTTACVNEEEAQPRGVHEAVVDAVKATDPEIYSELLHNVVLTGGSTMFAGFSGRLRSELKALVPSSFPSLGGDAVQIVSPLNPLHAAWAGGANLAMLSGFQQRLITREEYEEHGLRIVERKLS